MRKLIDTLSLIIVVLAIILVGFIVYTQVYPYKPIVVNGDFKILTPIVKAGEAVEYQVNATKLMSITGKKHCEFQDGLEYFLPEVDSNLTLGDHNEIVAVIIPRGLPPGDYIFVCKVDYQINLFRSVMIQFQTEHFEVIK